MASSVHNNSLTHGKRCMCCKVCNMWCWRAFKWIPVLLIVSIVTWSYYAYVFQLCIFTIENTAQRCIYLILYHILLVMFAWSYWQTIFTEVQPVPDRYKLPEAELEKLLSADSEDAQRTILENFAKDLPVVSSLVFAVRGLLKFFHVIHPAKERKKAILEKSASSVHVLTRTTSGSVRYCNRCVLIKPDRAHHCSICSRCVLKMDHHCPWVNNCVCYFNYKFFILFLGYALIYCLFITATSLPYFIKFWKGEFGVAAAAGRYHIVFAFFVSLMFAVSLGSLFGYHVYLVFNNRTTLETVIDRRTREGRTIAEAYYEGQESEPDSEYVPKRRTRRSPFRFGKTKPTPPLEIEDKSELPSTSLANMPSSSDVPPVKNGDMLIDAHRWGTAANHIVNAVLKSMIAEAFRAPTFRGGADKNGFSIGYFNNFKEVFGNIPHLWLLPLFTSLGDGCDFPVRREHELQAFTAPQDAHGYESMGTTRSSFGDGIVYPLPTAEEDTESLLSSERWDRWGERARPFDDRESSSFDEL